MSAPQFDRQKGCFYDEVVAYRELHALLPVYKVRFRDVMTDRMTRRQQCTTSYYVARLMLNLGHWVD